VASIANGIPDSIFIDSLGNLFVTVPCASPPEILKITPSGNISTIFSGLPIRNPVGITFDANGNLIVADNVTDSLFRIILDTGAIAEFAKLPNPSPINLQDFQIALDASGDIIVASDDDGGIFGVSTILRVTEAGSISTIYRGTDIQSISGLVIDPFGNFIVTDFRQQKIFKVTSEGSVSTIVSSNLLGFNMSGIVLDHSENFAVTVNFGKTILSVTPNGTIGTILSGSPLTFPGGIGVFPSPNSPVLSIDASSLDFQGLSVASTRDLTFTIQNIGGGSLDGSVSSTEPFSIISGSPFSIQSGGKQIVGVRFSPVTSGIFRNNITISSNIGDDAVSVNGIGFVSNNNPGPIQIKTITPSSGIPGDIITITGNNFGGTTGKMTVGKIAVSPQGWGDSFIQFILPNIRAGKYIVTLFSSTGGTATTKITILPPPPTITSLSPTSGSPGTTVLIDGFNFGSQQGTNNISIGNQLAQIISWDNERIAIKIPNVAPKKYPLQIITTSGKAKSTFTVKPLLLLTQQGPCDDSFLGALIGNCWVTVPFETSQNADGTVNVAINNIRSRWYEVTVRGASFSGKNPFLIGPNQALTLNNVTVGIEGIISFKTDGMSNKALLMDGADLLFLALTDARMPASGVDSLSSFMLGLCATTLDLCDFSNDLVDGIRDKSVTEIIAALAKLPTALAGDPITSQSFVTTFGLTSSQAARISSLGALSWLVSGVSVAGQELVYLLAPKFSQSCLIVANTNAVCE
jgi:hypothetical protein